MKFFYITPIVISAVSALVIPESFKTESFFRPEALAPLLTSSTASEHVIPDQYIIVFKKHVDHAVATEHHSWVSAVHRECVEGLQKRGLESPFLISGLEHGLKHIYTLTSQFRGYSGRFDAAVIELIRRHPDVEYVERDSMVYASEADTEKNAPWGLSRVSHRNALNFGTFNKYLYDTGAGEGVTAYVIDTGINIEHVDFEGRAVWGKTIPSGDVDQDGNGHGTHCSGTVAGKKYGVAKKAKVVAVKVLKSNGSGTMSDVIKGVEWAAESHVKESQSGTKGFKGSVANMSLGGGKSPSLDMAVNAAVELGIHFAVAAGNDNADACSYSPAAADKAITVGASTLGDERAYFSNYGKCVDIFGPGLNIQSTWIGSKYALNTISGTSMASPHVAGLLAYFVSLQPSSDSEFATAPLTPAKLKANVLAYGTPDALSDLPADTPNLLIYNGAGGNLSDFWSL
ncbi:peptidase S8/S53 domain-containing protein [Dipodascopsis tothii]|uniref:peptidase S8/S53 domain-containing protein n=1 Tax=Dipodascopsis tothii TaxID=44089 RepID=UPI0034CD5DD8